jgi:drug/metabolite transporter (DMT)-like permease
VTGVRATGLIYVYGALGLVQVFFGLQYVAAKVVLGEIAPQALAVIRAGGATLLLLLVTRLAGRRLPRSPDVVGRLALYALFGVALNQVLFVEGLSRTTPTHSSLINTLIPVATLVFAVIAGRERLSRRKVLSPVVAFCSPVPP